MDAPNSARIAFDRAPTITIYLKPKTTMPTKSEPKLHHTDAFQSDDDHPTITYVATDETLALPYHLVRLLRLGKAEKSILVEYDDYRITINGTNLTRLWRDLRAFRVKEVLTNCSKAAKAMGDQTERCIVERITIEQVENSPPDR